MDCPHSSEKRQVPRHDRMVKVRSPKRQVGLKKKTLSYHQIISIPSKLSLEVIAYLSFRSYYTQLYCELGVGN